MIERLVIRGFRLLRDVDVSLAPLTVLVGANNTGKTSVLQALAQLSGKTLSIADSWRHSGSASVAVTVAMGEPTSSVTLTMLASRAQPQALVEGGKGAWSGLRPCMLIELPRGGAAMDGTVVPDHAGPPPLLGDGTGLASLLDHLQRRDRNRYDRFVAAAKKTIPGLQDLTLIALSGEQRSVRLHIEGGFEIPGSSASAGVRSLLYFLGLAYHPTPPALLLVEEPETGLHPTRLQEVVTLLRELTTGEHGGTRTQVVLTTHSPYLLDHVHLGTDQVLVCRRGPEGDALIQPADPDRLKTFLGEFMLGEVWFNQGEAGLVAGPSQPAESAGS
ncbi:MAG: AAA family ATPase [Planctomycetes bacterium]|nr:AAA family ATPase [Planctomycetota bacterium]